MSSDITKSITAAVCPHPGTPLNEAASDILQLVASKVTELSRSPDACSPTTNEEGGSKFFAWLRHYTGTDTEPISHSHKLHSAKLTAATLLDTTSDLHRVADHLPQSTLADGAINIKATIENVASSLIAITNTPADSSADSVQACETAEDVKLQEQRLDLITNGLNQVFACELDAQLADPELSSLRQILKPSSLPTIDHKLLFHMFLDRGGAESDYEGYWAPPAYRYLSRFLDIKNGITPDPAVSKLAGQFSQAARVVNDLFGPIRRADRGAGLDVGYVAQDAARNLRYHLKNHLDAVSSGESLLLPFGWSGDSPHAMIMEVIKQDDSTVTLRVFNTGAGYRFHPFSEQTPVTHSGHQLPHPYRPWIERRDIPVANLLNPVWCQAWTEVMGLAARSDSVSPTPWNEEDVYRRIIDPLGGVVTTPDVAESLLWTQQLSGTCVWASAMAVVRTHLTEKALAADATSSGCITDPFLRFSFEIKLASLTHYFREQYPSETLDPKTLSLLYKSTEFAARDVGDALIANAITEKEASAALAILRSMQRTIEAGRAKYSSTVADASRVGPLPAVNIGNPTGPEAEDIPRVERILTNSAPKLTPLRTTYTPIALKEIIPSVKKALKDAYNLYDIPEFHSIVRNLQSLIGAMPMPSAATSQAISTLPIADRKALVEQLTRLLLTVSQAQHLSEQPELMDRATIAAVAHTLYLLEEAAQGILDTNAFTLFPDSWDDLLGGKRLFLTQNDADPGPTLTLEAVSEWYNSAQRKSRTPFITLELDKSRAYDGTFDYMAVIPKDLRRALQRAPWALRYAANAATDTTSKGTTHKTLTDAVSAVIMQSSSEGGLPATFHHLLDATVYAEHYANGLFSYSRWHNPLGDWSPGMHSFNKEISKTRGDTKLTFMLLGDHTIPESLLDIAKDPAKLLFSQWYQIKNEQPRKLLQALPQIHSGWTEQNIINRNPKSDGLDGLDRDLYHRFLSLRQYPRLQVHRALGLMMERIDLLQDPDWQQTLEILVFEGSVLYDTLAADPNSYASISAKIDSMLKAAVDGQNHQLQAFASFLGYQVATVANWIPGIKGLDYDAKVQDTQNKLLALAATPAVKEEVKQAVYAMLAVTIGDSPAGTLDTEAAGDLVKYRAGSLATSGNDNPLVSQRLMHRVSSGMLRHRKQLRTLLGSSATRNRILDRATGRTTTNALSWSASPSFPRYAGTRGWGNSATITLDVLSGSTRESEKASHRLPKLATGHASYLRLWGDTQFKARKMASNEYAFTDSAGIKTILRVSDQGAVDIYQALADSRTYRYTPKEVLLVGDESNPTSAVGSRFIAENYVTWDYSSGNTHRYVFCDPATGTPVYEAHLQGSYSSSGYSVKLHAVDTDLRQTGDHLVPFSLLPKGHALRKSLSFAERMEDASFVHVWSKNRHDISTVEFPRLQSSGRPLTLVNRNGQLSLADEPNYRLAQEQQVPYLQDFTEYLLFENGAGRQKLIIPARDLSGDHQDSIDPTVNLDRGLGVIGGAPSHYHTYELDPRTQTVNGGTLEARIFLANLLLAQHRYDEANALLNGAASISRRLTPTERHAYEGIISSQKATMDQDPRALSIRLAAFHTLQKHDNDYDVTAETKLTPSHVMGDLAKTKRHAGYLAPSDDQVSVPSVTKSEGPSTYTTWSTAGHFGTLLQNIAFPAEIGPDSLTTPSWGGLCINFIDAYREAIGNGTPLSRPRSSIDARKEPLDKLMMRYLVQLPVEDSWKRDMILLLMAVHIDPRRFPSVEGMEGIINDFRIDTGVFRHNSKFTALEKVANSVFKRFGRTIGHNMDRARPPIVSSHPATCTLMAPAIDDVAHALAPETFGTLTPVEVDLTPVTSLIASESASADAGTKSAPLVRAMLDGISGSGQRRRDADELVADLDAHLAAKKNATVDIIRAKDAPLVKAWARAQENALRTTEWQLKHTIEQRLNADRSGERDHLVNAAEATGGMRRHFDVRKAATLLTFEDPAEWKKANPTLTDAAVTDLIEQTTEYLRVRVLAAKIARVGTVAGRLERASETLPTAGETSLLEIDRLERTLGAAVTQTRAFAAADDHAALALEAALELMIWPGQYDALTAFENAALDDASKGLTQEKIMGSGKSLVMMPLHLFRSADGKHLSVGIVPANLYGAMIDELSERNEAAFGGRVRALELTPAQRPDQERVKWLRSFLEAAIKERTVLVMTSKTFQLLELFFWLDLHDAKSDNDARSRISDWRHILRLVKTSARALVDEVDSVAHVQREVVVPAGRPKALPALHIEAMAALHHAMYVSWEQTATTLGVPAQNGSSYDEQQRAAVARAAIRHLSNENGSAMPNSLSTYLKRNREHVIEYVSTDNDNTPGFRTVAKAPQQVRDVLALLRWQLTALVPSAMKKSHLEHYGLSRVSASPLAIPYRRANQPAEGSQFANPYETAVYTTLTWMKQDLPRETVSALLDALSIEASRSATKYEKPLEETEAYRTYARLGGTKKLKELTKDDVEVLTERINQNPAAKLIVIRQMILPQILHYPARLSSTPGIYGRATERTDAFTGTAWTRDMLPHGIKTTPELGTHGKILNLLWSHAANDLRTVDDGDLEATLSQIFVHNHAFEDAHALLDVGAVFKDHDREAVARGILNVLLLDKRTPSIKGVVFFNDGGDKMFLAQGAASATPFSEVAYAYAPEERFTYYDQARCVGSDLKQHDRARGVMTLNALSILRDAEQGMYRLRGIEKGQRLGVAIVQSEWNKILDVIDAPADTPIGIEALTKFLVVRQADRKEQLLPRAARQRIQSVAREYVHDWMLSTRTTDRDVVTAFDKVKHLFVTEDSDSLWDVVGTSEQTIPIQTMLEKTISRFTNDDVAAFDYSHAGKGMNTLKAWMKEAVDMPLPDTVRSRAAGIIEQSVEVEVMLEQEVEQEKEQHSEVVISESSPPHRSDKLWSEATNIFDPATYSFLSGNGAPARGNKKSGKAAGLPLPPLNHYLAAGPTKHVADLFADGLYATGNMMLSPDDSARQASSATKTSPLGAYQKEIEHVLVVRSGNGDSLDFVLLDQKEAAFFQRKLIEDARSETPTSGGVNVGLYHPYSGWVAQGSRPMGTDMEDHPRFKELLVKVKFLRGDSQYSAGELKTVKHFLTTVKNNVPGDTKEVSEARQLRELRALLEQRILRHKQVKRRRWYGSALHRLFEELDDQSIVVPPRPAESWAQAVTNQIHRYNPLSALSWLDPRRVTNWFGSQIQSYLFGEHVTQ